MIIQPEGPGGYTIFSDDVRYEMGSKLTYVGVYGGDMIVGAEPPVTLSQLCVTIAYRDSPEGLAEQAPYFRVVRITDDGSEELARVDCDIDFVADPLPPSSHTGGPESDYKIFSELRVQARLAGFKLDGPCRIAVRAYKGEDEVRLGSLNVKFLPPETPGQ